jgi:hypothetical protein
MARQMGRGAYAGGVVSIGGFAGGAFADDGAVGVAVVRGEG